MPLVKYKALGPSWKAQWNAKYSMEAWVKAFNFLPT
jgi:hypothetical protein